MPVVDVIWIFVPAVNAITGSNPLTELLKSVICDDVWVCDASA